MFKISEEMQAFNQTNVPIDNLHSNFFRKYNTIHEYSLYSAYANNLRSFPLALYN
jgi:hypothetical protein